MDGNIATVTWSFSTVQYRTIVYIWLTKEWISEEFCFWQEFSLVFSVCKSSRRMQKIKNEVDGFKLFGNGFIIVLRLMLTNINCQPCWCIQICVVLIPDRGTREQNEAQSWFQHFGFLCFWINNNSKICYALSETIEFIWEL